MGPWKLAACLVVFACRFEIPWSKAAELLDLRTYPAFETVVFTPENSPISSNTVRGLTSTPDSAVWVSTFDGVARFHDGNWQIFTSTNSGLPDPISSYRSLECA